MNTLEIDEQALIARVNRHIDKEGNYIPQDVIAARNDIHALMQALRHHASDPEVHIPQDIISAYLRVTQGRCVVCGDSGQTPTPDP